MTSNPFTRLTPAPIEGRELNPVLQDIGLAIHPPLLYLGYVGFSVCFSFAVAALMDGRIDAAWARWVRPWTLAAWMFLTGGVAMGSYWAYYELGWGGFWFWDPVENASFMPWLAGTALLHSAIVMEKRSALKIWTLLLAILTFSLSLLGTFLVRSGVLTSVHAFATDPTRGVFILAILTIFIGRVAGAFRLAGPDAGRRRPVPSHIARGLAGSQQSFSDDRRRDGSDRHALSAAGRGCRRRQDLGRPAVLQHDLRPLIVPLLAAVPFGPLLAWKRGDLYAVSQRLVFAFGAALVAVMVTLFFIDGMSALAAFGVGLAFWLMLGSLTDIAMKSGFGDVSPRIMLRRFAGLPRSVFGTALAHVGLGLSTLGIVSVVSLNTESITSMRPGDTIALPGYSLRYDGLQPLSGPNYTEDRGRFALFDAAGKPLGEISSAKRFYAARQMPTTEAGIATRGFSQIYVSLGDSKPDGAIVVRVWWKPLVTLIWIGALVMAAGGAVSLLRPATEDRRAGAAANAR